MTDKDDGYISANDVPCCPKLSKKPCCERLIYTYRLTHNIQDIPVEVAIRVLFERCPGPLSLGDLVYSTTLLPGERVRLFTSSRKNRFTFDSASQVSYRHEQTSEESFYMSSFDRFMSDISTRETINANESSSGSFRTDGSVSSALESLLFGPSATVSGSFNNTSTFDFVRELSSHAEASHERSVSATRASSSVSVGEVQTRNHAEGESESTFESATRSIANLNRCHAVTYFAYQINKSQTVRFKILSIVRRVLDPVGDSKVDAMPPRFNGAVEVLPQGVLATAQDRVSIEATGRASWVADRSNAIQVEPGGPLTGIPSAGTTVMTRPIAVTARTPTFTTEQQAEALKAVDEQLVAVGLLDKVGGQVSQKIVTEFGFERTTCLPTPAILVKGCLDDCNVCEPSRIKEIELDIARKHLENEMLEKQIKLLQKSQEYRCCPAGDVEDEEDDES